MKEKHLKFYYDVMELTARNSHCERKKVGCIIVKDHNIISHGWNGTPTGFNNDCECDGETNKNVIHAEANAITKLARQSGSCDGSTMFVTLAPCHTCALLAIQSGIKKVYYKENYRDTTGVATLIKAGIDVNQINYDLEL